MDSFVWLYTWPAASTLNVTMDSGIPFVRKHMISILISDTVRPNAAHTTTTPPIIFLSCSGDCETIPASSGESMPQSSVARTGTPPAIPPPPPLHPPFLPQTHQTVHDVFDRLNTCGCHVYDRREKYVEQEGREHAPLTKASFHSANHPEHTLSSSRAHACMQSWN